MTIPEIICAILLIISAGILIINIVIKFLQKKPLADIDNALLLIVPGVIFLFFIVLAYRYSDEIKLAEFLQILLMFGLVTVTIVYAWSASRQASTSRKMAKEMQNQRYDMVRPIIDIQWQPGTHGEKALMNTAGAIAIAKGQTPQSQLPDKLTCVLRNVGVGTATDVYSYVQADTQPDDECHQLRPFGLLPVNEMSGPWPLSLKEIENRKFIIVYYRDVHNRCFQSIREVSRDEKRGNLKLDPLGTSKLAKEVYRELNVGNYTGFLEKLWSSSIAGGILK